MHLDDSNPITTRKEKEEETFGFYLPRVGEGFVSIFAFGKNEGSPPSSRRRQQSTGLLHLDDSNLITTQKEKEKETFGLLFFFWGG